MPYSSIIQSVASVHEDIPHKPEVSALLKLASYRERFLPVAGDKPYDWDAMIDPRIIAADLALKYAPLLASVGLLRNHRISPRMADLDMFQQQRMGDLLEDINKKGITRSGLPDSLAISSHYNPKLKTIKSPVMPGPLAHEYGHATGKMIPFAISGKMLGRLSSIGTGVLRDRDTAYNSAYASSLAYTPTLLEELRATRNGIRHLKRFDLPGKLGVGAGLITYGATAAAPYATLKLRDHFGLWDPRNEGVSGRVRHLLAKLRDMRA